MFTVTRDQSVLYKVYVFEIYWGTHFPHQKLFWHQHVSTSSFLSVTRECMACSAEGGEHSLDSLNCCHPCPHRGPLDLQQKTEKEKFWYQKGDKIIPATMGLVPSDRTGLGQRSSELVKVWLRLGLWESGGWQAEEGCEVWVRHPVSYTTSWVQNFVLKQRTRTAKHWTKNNNKKSVSHGYLFSVLFQANKG